MSLIKKLKINKISIFTPYTDEINQSVTKYFEEENIEISELSYFDIASDLDIGRVDPYHLYDVLNKQWFVFFLTFELWITTAFEELTPERSPS